ncbi:hypothetical protein [Streptomyces sp. NPDC054887]
MATPDFRPTHVVPQYGLPAWEEPDVSLPTEPLDPLLPVRLIGRRGDWGQILCANGWSAWVDGRLLVSVPQEPPAAGQPMARTADPRPLLARVEESLNQYRRAAEDLTAGRTDGEGFRRRTRGLRVGMVVDGESVWLYDAEHERWVYCDGTRLATYAASSSPAADPPPGDSPRPPREPTRVADRPPADPGGAHEPTRVAASAAAGGRRPSPPDPPQVVAPLGSDPVGPVDSDPPQPAPPTDPAPTAAPPPAASAEAPEQPRQASPRAPEPTRIVTPPAEDPGGQFPHGEHAPEPESNRAAPPEPTRIVNRPSAGPGGQHPQDDSPPHLAPDRPAPPEPTRAVARPPAGPRGGAGGGPGGERGPGNGHEPGGGAPPEPTRIVTLPGGGGVSPPEPARAAGTEDDGSGGGEGRDREATRVVRPGDGTAPRPPTRPGDG